VPSPPLPSRHSPAQAAEADPNLTRMLTDLAVEAFDEGVVVALDAAIVVANDRFRTLFDLPRETCPVGTDLTTLTTGRGGRAAVPPELGDVLDEITVWFAQPRSGPCEVRGLDGRFYELRQRRTEAGRVGTVRDVTEQKTAFERTHQSQKMEALGSLAGGVAHEFNNLLLVIGGFAQTAHNRAQDAAAVRDALDEVLTACGRASELAAQMLTFSRNWVSEGKIVSVAEELDQLRRLVSLQARGVTLKIEADPQLRVQVDGANFLQALLNLTLNARDAMQRGGVLEISARRIAAEREIRSMYGGAKPLPPGDYAEIVVRDTGAGIPRETLPRIFEPFFTTKAPGEGTGLGLSFVFGVIKQAGGLIDVRSTPGEGTAFTIHLPASEQAVTVAPKSAPYAAGCETLLVVDDEEQVRRVAAAFLESLGYTVLQAGSALEALDVFDDRGDAIAMVLTDVIMPDMDGFELAEVLREVGCRAPIGFMTGCVPDLERDSERFAESSSIIRKPFSTKDIALFTRRVLDQREAA